MDIRWKLGVCRFFVWLAAEIVLSMLGIDDLADYSEFVFEKDIPVLISQASETN